MARAPEAAVGCATQTSGTRNCGCGIDDLGKHILGYMDQATIEALKIEKVMYNVIHTFLHSWST